MVASTAHPAVDFVAGIIGYSDRLDYTDRKAPGYSIHYSLRSRDV